MKAEFLIVGDSAVSIKLGSVISLEVNQLVRMLFLELEENPIVGIVETVPTYASMMIHYRPEDITYASLKEEIMKRTCSIKKLDEQKQVVKELPICYGGELGPDLADCAACEHVSPEELIRMHSQPEYYVYMLGFAPGHAYMARFEGAFHFKRRETPRVRIPGQSIVVQENLSNLIPFDQPCGWNIIGATPLTACDYTRNDPFLIHAGDWVKYIPISLKEFHNIREQDEKGTYHLKTYEKVVK